MVGRSSEVLWSVMYDVLRYLRELKESIEAERKAQRQQALATNLTSPPATKSTIHSQSAIKPGQYVLFLQDLSQGKCSYGG